MHPVSEVEWSFAHQYLLKAPDGAKLPYSMTRDLQVRLGYEEQFARYQTTHSFIKIAGIIYAMSQGKGSDSFLGSGTFGAVKQIENAQGQGSVVKIERQYNGPDEFSTLSDLDLTKGRTHRRVKAKKGRMEGVKYYTQMPYLGQCLKNVLQLRPVQLDKTLRIRLAIDLCMQVFLLHNGLNSSTGTEYAHLDLKPKNITIDANNKIHLVDYGSAKTHPDEKLYSTLGTAEYSPPGTRSLTKEQMDIIALKRSIYAPLKFYCANGLKNLTVATSISWSLLSAGILHELAIFPYFDTSADYRPDIKSFVEDKTTALFLSALLISGLNQLNLEQEQLKNNPFLCLVLVIAYEKKLTAPELLKIIDDIDPWLCSTLSISCKDLSSELIRALFINQHLRLGYSPATIINHTHLGVLLNSLYQLGLLRYLDDVLSFPEVKFFILKNPSMSTSCLDAFKTILQEHTHIFPSQDARKQCLLALIKRPQWANPELALAFYRGLRDGDGLSLDSLVNTPGEVASHNQEAEFKSQLDRFHLNSFDYDIRSYNPLFESVLADNNNSSFWFSELKKLLLNNSLSHSERYDLIDVLIYTQRCGLSSDFMKRYLPEILIQPEAVAAIQVLYKADCVHAHWIYRLGSTNKKTEASIFRSAINRLAYLGAEKEHFNQLFSTLLRSWGQLECLATQLFLLESDEVHPSAQLQRLNNAALVSLIVKLTRLNFLEIRGIIIQQHIIAPSLLMIVSRGTWTWRELNAIFEAVRELSIQDRPWANNKPLDCIRAIKTAFKKNDSATWIQDILSNSSACDYMLGLREGEKQSRKAHQKASHLGLELDFANFHKQNIHPHCRKHLNRILSFAETTSQAQVFFELCNQLAPIYARQEKLYERRHESRHCREVYQEISYLLESIEQAIRDFFSESDRTIEWRMGGLSAIISTLLINQKQQLTYHLGKMAIFDSVLTALACGVIFYPLRYCYQKTQGIHHTFFKPPIKKEIDTLERSLESFDAPVLGFNNAGS